MSLKIVGFLAIILMSLALVPSGAHLFELPNKMQLSGEAYVTVQGIYAGWALFGIIDFAALIANITLAVMLRREPRRFRLALVGAASLVAFFAVFFIWTFPANQATANWTRMPSDWEALRRAWEISHALNAVILFVGLCAVVLAAIDSNRERRGGFAEVEFPSA